MKQQEQGYSAVEIILMITAGTMIAIGLSLMVIGTIKLYI